MSDIGSDISVLVDTDGSFVITFEECDLSVSGLAKLKRLWCRAFGLDYDTSHFYWPEPVLVATGVLPAISVDGEEMSL